ncbi:MAG: methyltransferase MtaB domain-containing protein [Propionivibrio sp.]
MYTTLAIDSAKGLRFGFAPKPVTTAHGLIIGGGAVYPELNFTLPTITIDKSTMPEIREHYRGIVNEALTRAHELGQKGVVFEFETLMEMTLQPEIGIELTKIMADVCAEHRAKTGINSAIRLTPNDVRDFERPPLLRSSKLLDSMYTLFREGARAGGDLLSIESTGGKEVHDDALMYCDIKSAIFALTVLGVRDMQYLWGNIVQIAREAGRVAGGDSACGFANTAMVLADKKYIPKVFAAVDRAVSVVRALPAYEAGAVGPSKDCAYEGPFMKAIAGVPISMEGKTAACAHLSPVGNIAAAAADLWSNESVQNIKLLGGMAPTVYMEQLIYDCRLMNTSIKSGNDAVLQKLLVDSDIYTDPQALVLAPESVIAISREIVASKTHVEAGVRAALKAVSLIRDAKASGQLVINDREADYLDQIEEEVGSIPLSEDAFIEEMVPTIDTEKCILKEYGI